MKKVYSMIMMLALMVAAMNFTACSSSSDDDDIDGGHDDEEVWGVDLKGNTVPGYRATIEFDKNVIYEPVSPWYSMYAYHKYDNHIGMSISTVRDMFIYVDEMPSSNSNFNDYIKLIKLHSSYNWYECEYESGSAKVTKNDGEYLTVVFKDYKLNYEAETNTGKWYSHNILFNGTIKFVIEEN